MNPFSELASSQYVVTLMGCFKSAFAVVGLGQCPSGGHTGDR